MKLIKNLDTSAICKIIIIRLCFDEKIKMIIPNLIN